MILTDVGADAHKWVTECYRGKNAALARSEADLQMAQQGIADLESANRANSDSWRQQVASLMEYRRKEHPMPNDPNAPETAEQQVVAENDELKTAYSQLARKEREMLVLRTACEEIAAFLVGYGDAAEIAAKKLRAALVAQERISRE